MVLEDAMHATWGEKESTVITSSAPYKLKIVTELTSYFHWCNSGINVMGDTKHILIGLMPAP